MMSRHSRSSFLQGMMMMVVLFPTTIILCIMCSIAQGADLAKSNRIVLNEAISLHHHDYSSSSFSHETNSNNNDAIRMLQGDEFEDVCYTTANPNRPDRYCIIDNTPRDDLFLIITCPTTDSRDEYHECACTIGVGDPLDAPNTDTCLKCGFCTDNTLAYDCRNVADGNCIGVNCRGECISSAAIEDVDLLLNENVDASTNIQASMGAVSALFGIAYLLTL